MSSDESYLFRWIGLRNLKTLLLCSSQMGGDESPLFLRIEGAIGRIPLVGREVEDQVHGLAKELADTCYTTRNVTVSEVVVICDSVLINTADFLALVGNCAFLVSDFRFVEGEVIDSFVVQIKFLRNFILFAMRTGAELQSVLVQIQPIAINAARVLIKDTPDGDWFEEVQSKCSTLIATAIDPQLYQACTEALSMIDLRMSSTLTLEMEDDVFKNLLDSLISLLWDVLRHSMIPRSDQLVVLYERLRLSRATLKHSLDELFRSRIGFLVCDAGTLICSLQKSVVEIDLTQLSDLLQRFDVLFQAAEAQISLPRASESDSMEAEGSSLRHQRFDVLQAVEAQSSFPQASVSNLPEAELLGFFAKTVEQEVAVERRRQRLQRIRQLFGFDKFEISTNLEGLTRGSKQRRILQISGMAGLGKTTLAFQLYNHRSVKYYFQIRAWCAISPVLDKKKVLLQLLAQTDEFGSSTSNMSEDDLANRLRQSLKGKAYLIFLDDVWTKQVLDSLAISFPDDTTGSRIILTSRNVDIVPHGLLVNGGPYMLRLRTDHECLEILGQILFPESGWEAELLEFGLLTAINCKGLPLMVGVVAGILVTQDTQVWREIMEGLVFSDVSSAEHCYTTLELSYMHLPNVLQVCFTYFGVFPENQEISAMRLVQLWMGEGFIPLDHNISLSRTCKDIAREFLEELIERSLVMVVENRSLGGVKVCKIHDLLHDFCRAKVKRHRHFHLLLQRHDQLFDFSEPSDLQRLCIHSDLLHFKESRLFCPLARSILFFSAPESSHESCLFDMSFIIQIYRLLQVINMEQIPMSFGLPSDICLLTRLKFLSVQIIACDIPTSIGNLSNLETFIGEFWSDDAISFPQTLWNLQELNYLYIRNSRRSGHGFRLPDENLDDFPNLPKLEVLSGAVFHSDSIMEKKMKKFPSIRRLKCCILPGSMIIVPQFGIRLQSLTIQGSGKTGLKFGSTTSLRKLTLNGFDMSREEVAAIGNFPVLEVLKLLNTSFLGSTLEMEEKEFSNLRILHLEDNGNSLKRWTSSNDILPRLKKLIFSQCGILEEIPPSLETSSVIEEIQTYWCSLTLETLVRDIHEVQKGYTH